MECPNKFSGSGVPRADVATRTRWWSLAWTRTGDHKVAIDRNRIGNRISVDSAKMRIHIIRYSTIHIDDTAIAELFHRMTGSRIEGGNKTACLAEK